MRSLQSSGILAKTSSKQEIRLRIQADGYDPRSLTYYYISESGPITCGFDQLPDDLETFHCYGEDYRPWYHFARPIKPRNRAPERRAS